MATARRYPCPNTGCRQSFGNAISLGSHSKYANIGEDLDDDAPSRSTLRILDCSGECADSDDRREGSDDERADLDDEPEDSDD